MITETIAEWGVPARPSAGVSKSYVKGQKMKEDHGSTSTIMDFEAQTMTTIDNGAKTYKVVKFRNWPPVWPAWICRPM